LSVSFPCWPQYTSGPDRRARVSRRHLGHPGPACKKPPSAVCGSTCSKGGLTHTDADQADGGDDPEQDDSHPIRGHDAVRLIGDVDGCSWYAQLRLELIYPSPAQAECVNFSSVRAHRSSRHPEMGRAAARSAMIGRQNARSNVAMRSEIGELHLYEKLTPHA
jgi:hypothetical protein